MKSPERVSVLARGQGGAIAAALLRELRSAHSRKLQQLALHGFHATGNTRIVSFTTSKITLVALFPREFALANKLVAL